MWTISISSQLENYGWVGPKYIIKTIKQLNKYITVNDDLMFVLIPLEREICISQRLGKIEWNWCSDETETWPLTASDGRTPMMV